MSSMGAVTLVCALLFLIFGVMGTVLFGGRFYSCSDTTASGQDTCTGTFLDPSTNTTMGEQA